MSGSGEMHSVNPSSADTVRSVKAESAELDTPVGSFEVTDDTKPEESTPTPPTQTEPTQDLPVEDAEPEESTPTSQVEHAQNPPTTTRAQTFDRLVDANLDLVQSVGRLVKVSYLNLAVHLALLIIGLIMVLHRW